MENFSRQMKLLRLLFYGVRDILCVLSCVPLWLLCARVMNQMPFNVIVSTKQEFLIHSMFFTSNVFYFKI